MQETGVDRLYAEFSTLINHLDQSGEISLKISVDENFRKSLLMASASYFEKRLSDEIHEFFKFVSQGNELATSFVRAKAISRQYHTYFDWNGKNANQFFGLFGEGFKNFMRKQVEEDNDLKLSISAFLDIGNSRNRLAHEDFATFFLEKNSEEIYESYKTAIKFIEIFPEKLRQYISNN